MSRRCVTVFLFLVLFVRPVFLAAGETPVEAEKATETTEAPRAVIAEEGISMGMGLLVQAGFEAYPHQQAGRRNTFRLNRARLSLSGHLVSKHIRYGFEGDGVSGAALVAPSPAPGSEMRTSTGGVEVPFVLDAFVLIAVPKIHLTFKLGRFIPRWGLLMPARPSELGVVLYPLYVHGDRQSLGPFRDIGFEAALRVHRRVFAGGGLYNGGVNSWQDDNDRKDLSAFITLLPIEGLSIRAASLFKFRTVDDGVDGFGDPIADGEETHVTPCVEARYRDHGLDLIAGVALDFAFRDDDDVREDYRAIGAFAHAGYLFAADRLALAVRGEWWDPSDAVGDDERWRIIAGPTLRVETLHLGISVNYVQDLFASERAMCQNYLNLEACDAPDGIPEARKAASTVFLQVTLDI